MALLLVVFVFAAPAMASTRLEQRSLMMQSVTPGATTSYTLAFRYMSPEPVGSVDLLFCMDPIPYMPCVPPPGLDASHAVLSNQTGESGFSILSESTNHIVITRNPSMITSGVLSSYTFSGIINPSETSDAFSIRMQSHSTTDASGPQVDFGSVRGQVTDAIVIETQVPPMLIFCTAQQVDLGCTSTNDTYYSDMGVLSPSSTLTAQSQLAVGTNASSGFAITANGPPPSSGSNVITALSTPSASEKGVNQFGINLVANTVPTVGANTEGSYTNAIVEPGYDQPNKYKYVDGDVVAESSSVNLMQKYTVSYVVNSAANLYPGVYTTTITLIASGRF